MQRRKLGEMDRTEWRLNLVSIAQVMKQTGKDVSFPSLGSSVTGTGEGIREGMCRLQ
jgi:hypothetical protein